MVDRGVAKLRALVRIPTVSHRDPALQDGAAFDRFVEELAEQSPRLHGQLGLTHGLLFHWRGAADTRPTVALGTLLLLGSQCVAPTGS